MNLVSVGGLRHAKRIDLTLQSWRAQVLWPRRARLQAGAGLSRAPRSPLSRTSVQPGSHPAALRLWLPCSETPLPPQGRLLAKEGYRRRQTFDLQAAGFWSRQKLWTVRVVMS